MDVSDTGVVDMAPLGRASLTREAPDTDRSPILNTFPGAPNISFSSASLKHTHCYID